MSVTTPRIVVVSASRITRRVIEMTFADQPMQLAVFDHAEAAMAEWDTRMPAVLIADIDLQAAADGYGLARALRAHGDGARAAVVLLAGQTDGVDEAAAAAARVSCVIRKPLDSHQLIDAVREALREGPPAAMAASEAQAVATSETSSSPEPAALVEAPLDLADRTTSPAPESAAAVETAADTPSTTPADDALVATFHELLEVEQGLRPALVQPALGDDDVDRIAQRVAMLVAGDAGLSERLEASILDRTAPAMTAAAERSADRVAPEAVTAAVERVVRELAPSLVERVAQAVVRDEIARLRGTARVA